MPKISDERRAQRRAQILNAAWACFQREGLHATTLDDIIRASGLSAGAVYSYFKNKDDLIVAALTTSMSGISDLIRPLLRQQPLPPPGDLMRELVTAISRFAIRDGFDLTRIALLGWSEAQRNERLKSVMRPFYVGIRDDLVEASRSWQRTGIIGVSAPPEILGKILLSLVLGFVVQARIIGDIDADTVAVGLRDFGGVKSDQLKGLVPTTSRGKPRRLKNQKPS